MDYLKIGVLAFFFTLGVYLLGNGLVKLFTPNAKTKLRVKAMVVSGMLILVGCYFFYRRFSP